MRKSAQPLNFTLARRTFRSAAIPAQVKEAVVSGELLGHCHTQLLCHGLAIFALRLQRTSFGSWGVVRGNHGVEELCDTRLAPSTSNAWFYEALA